MTPLSYRRHRVSAEIIQHAIWLYLRFTLSYRDVEELLAERGLDVSYETVRRWVLKFGPLIARKLRQGRPRPIARWHLDEMIVRVAGKRMYPDQPIVRGQCRSLSRVCRSVRDYADPSTNRVNWSRRPSKAIRLCSFRSRPSTAMGHGGRFPPRRLSVRCRVTRRALVRDARLMTDWSSVLASANPLRKG
jgi:hypothetical protein